MKNLFFLTTFCLTLMLFQPCLAQHETVTPPILPWKTSESVLYGKDIEINNLPGQNQQVQAICKAPNGWLYGAYVFDSANYHYLSLNISKNQGITWEFVGKNKYLQINAGEITTKIDIIVTGNDSLHHKLLIAQLGHEIVAKEDWIALDRFNCEPFTYEKTLVLSGGYYHHDFALASDNNYPALNSSPNSVGFLFSTGYDKDSIIFFSSADGGTTFGNRRVLAVTNNKFHKVALTYGRSLALNTGKYFAAWEEQADSNSTLGHIYTAHSNPDFNSPFTTGIKMDALDPLMLNVCRNPAIACQVDNSNNDSANISQVLLFEKFNSGTGEFDIAGFYNLQATTNNGFKKMAFAATSANELQPDICYNQYDSAFWVTYYDSTQQKLPVYKKGLNLSDPDNWGMITPYYNSTYEISAPKPRIKINDETKTVMNTWHGQRTTGRGVALFNAPYIPATGISDQNQSAVASLILVFPNPCSNSVNISFELKKQADVTIKLCNLVQQPVGAIIRKSYDIGVHSEKLDLSEFPAGLYFYSINSGASTLTGKICIVR
jgi:hypothetical protein